MSDLKKKPKDYINPKWIQIAKRMNSIARQNDGLTAIKVNVVATSEGVPVVWWCEHVALEPRLEMNVASLEKKLGKEDLQNLLQYIAANV